MEGYLGEFPVEDLTDTPYAAFTPTDWVMHWIEVYGQIDGDHHKAWVLDQVARILKGTPVVVTLARWENGAEEYRESLGEPSAAYLQWVEAMSEVDGVEYEYSEGIAP